MAELGETRERADLRDALSHALGDPALELAFWTSELNRYVDALGSPAELPAETDARRTVTEIDHHGERVAAIVHDRAQDRATVRAAGAATALLLENQRLDAELRARLVELAASAYPPRAVRRRRAPAPRARSPRRRAVTAGRPGPEPSPRAHGRERGLRHRGPARHLHRRAQAQPRRAARSRPRHPSGRAVGSRARARLARAGGARSTSRSRSSEEPRVASPQRWRQRPISSCPRASPTCRSTRRPRARRSGWSASTDGSRGGQRRRRGRRQRRRRLRAPRAVRPRGSPQRHAGGLGPPGHGTRLRAHLPCT